jgi:clan AA aspartic protease (TIGR02281 family)
MNKLLSPIATVLALTACANNASTGYNGIDPTSAAADKCHKTAAAVTTSGDENLEYWIKCMTQYGYMVNPRGRWLLPQIAGPHSVSSTVSAPSAHGREEVQLDKRGSSYYVPVRINDTITIPFLLDTGAGDLVIPEDVARTLIRAGALKSGDFIGKRSYQIANGSEEVSPLVRIREVRVGDHAVRNVTAGITPSNGEPLLGQSFLSKFGAVTIDYKRLVLVLSP